MTQSAPKSVTPDVLFCAAFELSATKWRVAFTDGAKIRQVTIVAGDFDALEEHAAKARKHFKLEKGHVLSSCYEAGRDGFWIHRRLEEMSIVNHVLDSASIEVSRRARRAKSDSLDAESLVRILIRLLRGEKKACSVVKVPTVEMEDSRRIDRERERLSKEKTQHLTRMRALLVTQGIELEAFSELPLAMEKLKPTCPRLVEELEREKERLTLVLTQIKALDERRRELLESKVLPWAEKAEMLARLKAIGEQTSSVLSSEFFGWREFANGKQVGACAGFTPTPYSSGASNREQGISKAGSRRIRRIMVEVAWMWLRYQPQSTLSKWFEGKFAKKAGRSRRVGIVALARKLLVALWSYLERGVVPEGALMKT